MITTKGIRVWTPRGWLFADNLLIGDRVLSFNPERNCCEYDKIYSVQIEYTRCMGLGIFSKSMHQVITPQHPILVWNIKRKTLSRPSIESRFMGKIDTVSNNTVLCHSTYEPHLQTRDIEEIKLCARRAATYCHYSYSPENLWPYVQEISGYEAQIWLETFFHWNVMVPAKNWMATVKIKNKDIREMLFYIAPRAGVGVKFYTRRGPKLISITSDGNINVSAKYGWVMEKIDGLTFNVTTQNGNVLVKSSNGTHLTACDYKGG